nr:RHS repeat-associated core domain-containing protein [Desulfovibrio sp. JC010]
MHAAITPQQPQTGTGPDLHDEFEHDGVEFNPDDAIRVTPFAVPNAQELFSVLGTERNEDGRIIQKLQSLEPLDHHLHYEYDAGGRLHKVWKGKQIIEEYLYGKYGERYFGATPQTGQRRFLYGSGLRLEKVGNVKYSYDDQGRLIRKQDGCVVTSYEYHHSGQLQQVKLPDGRRISYTIDPDGKRTSKSVNGKVVETYLWHNLTTLTAFTDEYGKRTDFAYDNEGDPIAMRCGDEVYYLASDQVGTIYMVADDHGNEIRRIIRDSFGNMTVDTNERIYIPLGFAAGLHDRDTGLVHFGHREYDPSIGRFIQPDPLGLAGGDVDVYGYCHDDPVNFIDRVGLAKVSEEGAPADPPDEETDPDKEKENENFYWTVTPKKNACEKCQALKGKTFEKEPERPHPNCKCEIERHFKGFYVSGILQGQGDSDSHEFGASQKIVVEVTNLGPFLAGARIQVDGSVWENTGWMAPGQSDSFEFTKFGEIPVPWEVAITCDGADNCTITYSIRG